MRSASTRRPRMASSAGRKVSENATASSTTAVPASPIETMLRSWRQSMPRSPMATVRPEKSTARPAVAKVRPSAAAPRPSAQLVTIAADDEEGVVDRHAEAHHRDHVDRVHGDGRAVRERDGRRHAGGDAEDAHAERKGRAHHGAEDEHEQQRHHRPDHPLGAANGARGRLREVVVERHRPYGKDLERLRADLGPQLGIDAALAWPTLSAENSEGPPLSSTVARTRWPSREMRPESGMGSS